MLDKFISSQLSFPLELEVDIHNLTNEQFSGTAIRVDCQVLSLYTYFFLSL